MMNVAQCLDDPNLFGEWFSGPTWSTWRAVLKAAFCIPMNGVHCARDRGACHPFGKRCGVARAQAGKTDRLDAAMLMRVFLGWLRGERGHCVL